jgi:hypothetical protein
MAITHVQRTPGSTYGSFTIALSSVAAGNLLTLQYGTTETLGGVVTITSISDSAGQTWIKAAQETSGSNSDSEIWYLANANAGTHTLTVTCPAASTGSSTYTMDEWSGVQIPHPLDATNVGFNNAGTTSSPAPSITPTSNGELVLTVASASTGNISSPGGSWNAFTTSGSTVQLGLWQVQGTAAAISATFTDGSSAAWNQVIVSFLPTSSPVVMIL